MAGLSEITINALADSAKACREFLKLYDSGEIYNNEDADRCLYKLGNIICNNQVDVYFEYIWNEEDCNEQDDWEDYK